MFFMLPYIFKDTSRRSVVPVVNAALLFANILVFVCGWSAGWVVGSGTGFWSVFTYAFAHANLFHLGANMLVLLVVGTPVNRRIGNGNYLALYLGTVLASGVFLRLFCNGRALGSSGAIMAVIAAGVILLPAATVRLFYFALFPMTLLIGIFRRPQPAIAWFIRCGTFELRAVWGILLVPVLELLDLFCTGWNWTNFGHLLGFVCGVAAVLMMPVSITMPRRVAQYV